MFLDNWSLLPDESKIHEIFAFDDLVSCTSSHATDSTSSVVDDAASLKDLTEQHACPGYP